MLRMASSAVQFKRALTLLTVIIFSLTLLTLLSFSIIGQILCPPFIVQAQQKQASSPCQTKHCPYSSSEQKQSTKVNNNNINNNNNNTDNNNMKVRKKCMFDGSASRNLICTVQLLTFTVLRALILATLPTVGINGTIVSPDNAPNSLHDNSHASNEYFIHERNHRKSAVPALWPRPSSHSSGNVQYLLSKAVQYMPAEQIANCDIITAALVRYSRLLNSSIHQLSHQASDGQWSIYRVANMSAHQYDQTPKLDTVHLLVSEPVQCADYPDFISGVSSENYSIEVRSTISANSVRDPRGTEPGRAEAVLLAPTVWGLLRALETFTQLFYPFDVDLAPDTEIAHSGNGRLTGLFINNTKIVDSPAYDYRGIMIDTARHFIPAKLLIKNLEAMSYSKLNTMHWHLSDDQAFSYSSEYLKTFENQTKNSRNNYGPQRVYSLADIESIVAAGRLRGIQIIPEIDTPSHSKALGTVRPELLIHCTNNGGFQLNPILEETHEFVASLFRELAQVLPNLRVHIGLDDVSHRCWLANKSVQQFMATHGLANGQALEGYYIEKLCQKLDTFGRRTIIWQDPLDNGVPVPNGTIVQIWKDNKQWDGYGSWQSYAHRATIKSYSIIVSACWFMSEMKHAKDWADFYSCNPASFTANDVQRRLLLGGEACLWSDYIDATNLMPILWPRAAAVAERLWSRFGDSQSAPNADVLHRLTEHRCRLLRRGIAAQPIQPGFCDYFDWNDQQYPSERANIVSKSADYIINTADDDQINSINSNVDAAMEKPIAELEHPNNELQINKYTMDGQQSRRARDNPIFVTNLDQSWSWHLVSEGQSRQLGHDSRQASHTIESRSSAHSLFHCSVQYSGIAYREYSLVVLLTFLAVFFGQ